MKQGLRITIYVDDVGDPTGESYLEALWVPETRPWSLTCRDAGRC